MGKIVVTNDISTVRDVLEVAFKQSMEKIDVQKVKKYICDVFTFAKLTGRYIATLNATSLIRIAHYQFVVAQVATNHPDNNRLILFKRETSEKEALNRDNTFLMSVSFVEGKEIVLIHVDTAHYEAIMAFFCYALVTDNKRLYHEIFNGMIKK